MNKFQLAKYIVGKYPGSISPMKLQKLMYYCYVWQLVAGEKIFEASFEAWQHGPVDPDIYGAYKSFGASIIAGDEETKLQNQFIDFVLDSYSVYSAIELSKTTHEEDPWKMYVTKSGIIPDDILVDYYSPQVFAKNFPLKEGNIYYPPKTTSHYAFTFDMEKEYVPEFSNIEEYLNSFSTEKERLSKMLSNYGIKN